MARTYRSTPEPVYAQKSETVVKGGAGTTVVANPELAGTEPALTGLEVNNVKYAVPQGGQGGNQLYNVGLYCMLSGYYIYLTIQVDDNSLETYEDLAAYLKNHGFTVPNTSSTEGYFLPTVGYLPHTTYGVQGIAVADIQGEYGSQSVIVCYSEIVDEVSMFDDFVITYLGQNQGE